MNCMKCGKETVLDRAFCEECLEQMQRYPVNPNTPVVLPKRSAAAPVKKAPRKKAVPPEEQVVILRRRVRILASALLVMTLLAAALVYPAVKYMMEDHFLPGQNYSSIVSKSSAQESDGN